MDGVTLLTVLVIVGSLGMMLAHIRRGGQVSRELILTGTGLVLLGMFFLSGALIPSGVIRTTTESLFLLPGLYFLGRAALLDWKDLRASRNSDGA